MTPRVNLAKYRMDKAKEILTEAKDIREDADYGDFVKITQEDARNQIDNAEKFVAEAEKVLFRIIENAGR